MRIRLHRTFEKDFKKYSKNIRTKFYLRANLLLKDRNNPILGRHGLDGKFIGKFSINIGGDLRAIYSVEGDTYLFRRFGTHGQLYG